MARMMRVAYFSPLPPVRSGISHYSEELLPHLCRRAHVDVYSEDRIAAAQEVGRIYPLYGYRDFSQAERYDHLIFQLGNSTEHLALYDLFLRHGGIAVLHDLDFSEIVGVRTLGQGDSWGYLWEVRRNDGLGPFLRTAGDTFLRSALPGSPPPRPERGHEGNRPGDHRPMNRAIVQRASGVIVHSGQAREHLSARYPEARVRRVPLGIRRPPAVDQAEARQHLGLPADAFICISVGRLAPEKRVNVAMQGFARLLERCPNALYVLVGETAPGYPLVELAESLGIGGQVRLPGYVDLATLYRYLAAADVGIGLHDPRPAQVSASLLRIMSMGKPVLACDCPSHAHLPVDVALRVDLEAGEVAEMVAALWALSSHAPMRTWYGRQAVRYVQANHSPAGAARQYIEFMDELSAVQAAEDIMLKVGQT